MTTHTALAIIHAILAGGVLAIEALLALPLAYLALLSLAALTVDLRTRRVARQADVQPTGADDALPRLAILIPAHDEAAVIGSLLASLARLDYPTELYTPLVIADNCADQTAAIARAAGVRVLERTSEGERAKGYALRWALERLAATGERFDAYVIVDADSRLSPNFPRAMAAALARGAVVAQARYAVQNARDGWAAGLRAVAFALFNHVRPLGRSAFGWSAGLKGNGMCLRADVIERFGWGAYSLAEDAEYHYTLLAAGIHVAYVPEAVVQAEMPTSLRQARSQQTRWERGRSDLARSHAPHLVAAWLRTRDLAPLDAALELLLPPLSLVAVATLAALVGALLLAGALALHLVAGLVIARLPVRAWLTLLAAPIYIAWKCWVYAVSLVGRRTNAWVRTPRNDEHAPAEVVAEEREKVTAR
jgi:cellulose synthase/poly-beta-1,6-N-acetylglucosamine synthase-like glycosyltransferase